MTPWLTILGMSEAGPADLSPAARAALAAAPTIIGPQRLLDRLAPGPAQQIPWTTPLAAMLAQLDARRGSPTLVLATGDPLWFGIGATLARRYEAAEMVVLPHLSAFQHAAARLGWPLHAVTTLSLHGRPVASLAPHILPSTRILALTANAATATEVAALLTARGYGPSRLTVLENLGAPTERVISAQADGFAHPIGDFYVLAIQCQASPGAPLLPPVPGLPDTAFVSDGQLTKRDVRAATLAKLAPYAGALLWDVGAGCGSVAIEWLRAAPGARAIAFERDPARLAMIAANAEALGTPGLAVTPGQVPQTLVGAPAPDAVFLGGDVANPALFEACWAALKPYGRLVANAVTLDSEQALYARQAQLGGELTRLEISVLDTIGSQRVLRPRMAVTQWLIIKPGAAQ